MLPPANILEFVTISLVMKALPRVDREPPIFTLWRVLIDDMAVIEDCVKMSPCVYRDDITDKPPAMLALPVIERFLVVSSPLMKVDAPTAKLPVVEMLLPTKRGPAVDIVELVFKTPLMLMFVVLMKGA